MSFQSLRFYVKSVCRIVQLPIWNIGHYLREINIGEFRSWKKYVFVIFRDLNFVNMVNISLLKVQKFTRIKIQSLQNWFHVKSVWQKNPEISTLCSVSVTDSKNAQKRKKRFFLASSRIRTHDLWITKSRAEFTAQFESETPLPKLGLRLHCPN